VISQEEQQGTSTSTISNLSVSYPSHASKRVLIINKKIKPKPVSSEWRETRNKDSKQPEEKGPPQIDPVTPFYSNFYSSPRAAPVVPLVAGRGLNSSIFSRTLREGKLPKA
jgi:hypothetical protein